MILPHLESMRELLRENHPMRFIALASINRYFYEKFTAPSRPSMALVFLSCFNFIIAVSYDLVIHRKW